ncbi:actin cytoskeleton-regulatory complex protein pan1 [Triticum aestivum]|nr:actin cytoskeleton-regulatory complex protein pan1-like [Triticum aestivum]
MPPERYAVQHLYIAPSCPVVAMGQSDGVAAAPKEPDLAPKLPWTAAAGSPGDQPPVSLHRPRRCTVPPLDARESPPPAPPHCATAGRARIPAARSRPAPPRPDKRKGNTVPAATARALLGDALRWRLKENGDEWWRSRHRLGFLPGRPRGSTRLVLKFLYIHFSPDGVSIVLINMMLSSIFMKEHGRAWFRLISAY